MAVQFAKRLSSVLCPSCEERRPLYASLDDILGKMELCVECGEGAEKNAYRLFS